MIRAILSSVALVAILLWPVSAGAQIFGRGARTEFISGFGIRTFVSFLEASDLLRNGQEVEDPLGRRFSVRVTPFVVAYGLLPRVSLIAMFPIVRKELRLATPTGSETLGGDTGLGDATLLVKWRFLKRDRGRGSFQLAVTAGVKTPTGRDDLRDRKGNLLPASLQRGSGSWDPTADLNLTFVPPSGRGRWIFTANVGATLSTAANGLEQGDRLGYDGMVKYRIFPARYPGRDTFLLLELNGRWQGRSRTLGVPIESSGGHLLYLSPGLQFLLLPNLVLEAGVQFPIRRSLNGTQLAPGVNALAGLRYIIVP